MSDNQEFIEHPKPVVEHSGRSLKMKWLIPALVVVIVSILAIVFLQNQTSDLYVLIFMGILAALGILCIFALSIGLLRFGAKEQDDSLSKAFLDSSVEGVLVTAPDGHIIYANAAYAELTGLSESQAVRSVERVFAGFTDAAESLYRLAQAAENDRRALEEIRLPGAVNGDGTGARWYRIRVRPLAFEDGRKNHTVWQVADITRDRERQENIFQELQLAIDYLDHAPAGFLATEADGSVIYVNATLSDWLGYDLAQFEPGSLSMSDLVSGDGIALLSSISAAPGSVRTETVDLDLLKRNGQSLPVRVLHRVAASPEGATMSTRSFVLNRSPGEDVSESLRVAEVRFARFFNNTPIAIAGLDRNGVICSSNAPFLKLFGDKVKTGENSASVPIVDCIAERDRDALSAAIEAALSGSSPVSPVDAAFEGGDDQSVRFFVNPVEDADTDDGREAVIVYALDVTEQRALESQFAQSQKMQAVGQLAGGVAHDFNNVLTAIIGFSDLLLANHRPTDAAFQDIMNIKQNANRAAGLVRQLLAFSRRQTLRPQVLALPDVMADLSILLDRLLGEKVELDVSHGRDVWPIKADLNQLEQVVINLAVNARDAMPDGGSVRIRTSNLTAEDVSALGHKEVVESDQDFTMIEVEDTGTGIEPDILNKIFEPFFSTKDVGKGTGLGLSTVYGIVKQTGGYIFALSTVGEGTTFRILLPRHVEEKKADEKAPVELSEAPPQVADLTGNATILLVEDEEAVRAFGARALSSRGYKVHEAGTGTEALEIMEETDGQIDLVVSDVVMPEMDGPTLLGELRKQRPDLQVIFVSGYAEDAFRRNLPENETFHFLPKPFSLKQLATKVKEVLSETNAG
ncbi:cell cycle histidine kinase CckA [Coralliovum pocilloporae]|uniref:cell cycle histidine kinase CckA n=1 Tax=Coralliovum pocilloporae TaxID=3066369 RepID=UPI003306D83F